MQKTTDSSLPGVRMIGVVILISIVCWATVEASAEELTSLSKLTIVDGNGVPVGPVVGDPMFPTVVFRTGPALSPTIFAVHVNKFGFWGAELFYEQPECQGDPYLFVNDRSMIPLAGVLGLGEVYLPDSIPLNLTIVSRARAPASIPPACENVVFHNIEVRRASKVLDLHPTFIPFFTVRETPRVPDDTPIFNDVPPGHPFFPFIQAVGREDFTHGCSATPPLFCPDTPFTRGQAAVWFTRGLRLLP